MSPRVHVSCGFMGEQDLLELLPAIERLGFDGVTLPDHVFLPEAKGGRYPYSTDGRPPFRPTTPWPDQLVLAGAIGARTTRLAVTTAVLVLPSRHPLLVAKAAATAARLCGGRLALGIGAGWQREEFDALGVDFRRRGALMDEAICALRALWASGSITHEGQGYRFGPLLMEPKPPAVPLVIGGASDAALRRAVTLGDGWFLPTQPLDTVPEQLDRLRLALDQAGRDRDGFRVFVSCVGADREGIDALDHPLVTDVVVMPWAHPGKVDETTAERREALETWVA